MTKNEVIVRFCALSSKVQEEHFNYSVPADCFCGAKPEFGSFQFAEEVIKYIETAVHRKLDKQSKRAIN